MWTRLWPVPTVPKICHFRWKVVRNWVACKANLFKRKCAPFPICPISNVEPETIEHTLFRCPWTRAMWFGNRKSFWTVDHDITSTGKWTEDLLCGNMAKETTMEDMAVIFHE